jgi:hypothetical protein
LFGVLRVNGGPFGGTKGTELKPEKGLKRRN